MKCKIESSARRCLERSFLGCGILRSTIEGNIAQFYERAHIAGRARITDRKVAAVPVKFHTGIALNRVYLTSFERKPGRHIIVVTLRRIIHHHHDTAIIGTSNIGPPGIISPGGTRRGTVIDRRPAFLAIAKINRIRQRGLRFTDIYPRKENKCKHYKY